MHTFLPIQAHCSRLPAPAPLPHSLLHPWNLETNAPNPLLCTRAHAAQSTGLIIHLGVNSHVRPSLNGKARGEVQEKTAWG